MSSGGPKVAGHPAMSNVMAIAQYRSKLAQGKQKMDYEQLKMQHEAKRTKLETEKLKAQAESQHTMTTNQLKLMRAKAKADSDKHELAKKNFKLNKEQTAHKLKTTERFQKLKDKAKSSVGTGQAQDKAGSLDLPKPRPTNRRSPAQQKSPRYKSSASGARKSHKASKL